LDLLIFGYEDLAKCLLLGLEEVSSEIKPTLLDSWKTMSKICHLFICLFFCLTGVAVTLHTTLILACYLNLRDVQVCAGLFDMFVTLH
jgi:hypothetical protein